MGFLEQQLPNLAVVIALLCAERIVRAPRTDLAINLLTWAVGVAAGYTVYRGFTTWQGPALIDAARLPVWLAVPLFVLVYDLGEYLFHRLQHVVPLLWTMHSLHHSDPEMSVLTTGRHFWGEHLIKTLTVWSASALVISPTREAVFAYSAISLWNWFTHSRLEVDLGRWSWLINSPAYHRRHHSALPRHYNSNFAALFPLWDVLSGAYRRPDGFPPTGLGLRPRNLGDVLLWPWRYHQAERRMQNGRESFPSRPSEA